MTNREFPRTYFINDSGGAIHTYHDPALPYVVYSRGAAAIVGRFKERTDADNMADKHHSREVHETSPTPPIPVNVHYIRVCGVSGKWYLMYRTGSREWRLMDGSKYREAAVLKDWQKVQYLVPGDDHPMEEGC